MQVTQTPAAQTRISFENINSIPGIGVWGPDRERLQWLIGPARNGPLFPNTAAKIFEENVSRRNVLGAIPDSLWAGGGNILSAVEGISQSLMQVQKNFVGGTGLSPIFGEDYLTTPGLEKDQEWVFHDSPVDLRKAAEYAAAGGAASVVYDLGINLPPMLAFGLLGGAAGMGQYIYGSSVKGYMEEGVPFERAAIAALGNAVTQAPLEYLGFSKGLSALKFKGTFLPRLLRAGEAMGTEGFTEYLQKIPEELAAAYARGELNPVDIADISKFLGGTFLSGAYQKEALYEGFLGALTGGLFGIAGSGNALGRLQEEKTKNILREVQTIVAAMDEDDLKQASLYMGALAEGNNLKAIRVSAAIVQTLYQKEMEAGKISEEEFRETFLTPNHLSLEEFISLAENGHDMKVQWGSLFLLKGSRIWESVLAQGHAGLMSSSETAEASARAEEARVVSEEEKRIDDELEPELARVRDEEVAAGRSRGEAEGFARTLGAFARAMEIRSKGQMKALDIVRGLSQKRESQASPQSRKKAYTVNFANGDSLEVTVERLADGSMEVTDNRGNSQRIEKQDVAQINKLSDKAIINSLYNDKGGISKYRGKPMDKPMDKGEPVLDEDGNVLFQAPHISDFYDPRVEWNMDLPENAETNLVNANDSAKLASWWHDGMTVKEARNKAWDERIKKLWTENVPALGQEIIITHAGLMEPTGRGNKDVSARIFALLPPLVENAKLLRSEPDVNSKDITALRNHHLYAVINFNSHPYVIQISVKEKVIEGKTIFEYHGHRVLNIKALGLPSSHQEENSSAIPILPNASNINIIDALDTVKNKGSRIPENLRQFLEYKKANPGNPDILLQRAFHGGPHRFDRFSSEHIGSGEGMQAHGWGLYFAGKRELAEWYRKRLSAEQNIPKPSKDNFYVLQPGNKDWTHFMHSLGYEFKANGIRITEAEYKRWLKEAKRQYKAGTGQLYEAEIPEDDVLLDYDKPLSEQPEKVRDALLSIKEMLPENALADLDGDWSLLFSEENTGQEFCDTLSALVGGDKQASMLLNQAGIPGLRYLDGSSRDKGEGSHNYVIFDDAAIQIMDTFYQQELDKANILGAVTPEMTERLPLKKAGNIRLEAEDLQHIEEDHGEQIRGLGYANAREFINFVLAHIDAIYQGKNNRTFEIVTRQSTPQGRVVARLEFAESGDGYKIKTANPVRKNYYEKKTPLWEGAHSTLHQSATPEATRRASELGQSEAQLNLTTATEEVNKFLQTQIQAAYRGKIEFEPTSEMVRAAITYFPSANASTPPHELAHYMRRVLERAASLPGADPQLQADLEAAGRFVGLAAGGSWDAEYQAALAHYGDPQHPEARKAYDLYVAREEKFADAFLTYLMEGKAPSPELQSTFARFASWLAAIWRAVRGNMWPEINPEMRAVFDRLLATDEQIEAMSASGEVFMAEVKNHLSAEQYQALAEALRKSRQEAIARANQRSAKELINLRRMWRKEAIDTYRRLPIGLDSPTMKEFADTVAAQEESRYLQTLAETYEPGRAAEELAEIQAKVLREMLGEQNPGLSYQEAERVAQVVLQGKSLDELVTEMEELKANIRQAERQANQALQALGKAQEEKKEQLARQALEAKERQKLQLAKLRLAFERRREIESFARRAGSIMSQTPSGPSKTSGLPYQHMEQLKGLLSLLGLAPANWKMDKRLPSFRDFLQGLRENYDVVVSPEVVNWMSGYPPVYEKGEKKGRVKTLAGLSYEEFSLLKEAFDNLVHIGHEQGGINKYRGKRGDMSEPVLDDNGKVLFQAPHISEIFDPRIKWNVELLTDNTPVYFVSDKDGLADWWQEGITVKEARKTILKSETDRNNITIPALDKKVVITSSGLKEPTGRGNKEISTKVFAQLQTLLQNAHLLRTENDITSSIPQKIYHLYAFMVDNNGIPYAVQFLIRERTWQEGKTLEYYGQRVLKMEMPGLPSLTHDQTRTTSVQPGTSAINIIDALDAVKNKGSRIPEHLRRFLEDIKMNPGNPDILYQAAMPPAAWRNSPFFDLLP